MHLKSLVLSTSIGLLCTATLCAWAGALPEKRLDNSLTPKEVSQGWIKLFDGESDFGWRTRGEAKWKVHDGLVEAAEGGKGFLSTTTEFANYELQADFWIDDKANSGVFLRCPAEGEITPFDSYEVNIYDPHAKWPTGSVNEVARTKFKIKSVGKWTHFDILAEGDHLVVKVNGKKTLDEHNSAHVAGVIGLQYAGEGKVQFKNLFLHPLSLKSVFNGKDLTGWKPVLGFKSVYSVTPEGWLKIKNGPGEIQTEGAFGDFALQVEIFSNGDHLNSGIFYRANTGKFWEGYEQQIRNQWEGDDRMKAVDFGTGGIYNRQPARRVVSSDREWFTMSLFTRGKHHGSWVNGIMVADYTDVGKEDQTNARKGCRTAPGVIGLQGHDPTTDLSFRNIRVAELPK